jgi:phenylacetate-CoA ligase
MMLRSWALKHVLMPVGDRIYRHGMMPRLRLLEQAQWWSGERIAAERNRLLRETVEVAYRDVPVYRDLMDARRLKPADIRSPEDLRKLPQVNKTMLREGYPGRTTRSTGLPVTEEHTSGSTGRVFKFLEDRATSGWYRAAFLLALQWSGWRLGEPHAQIGIAVRRTPAKQIKDSLLGCHYIVATDLRDQALDAHLQIMERRRIRYLWGYPDSMYFLAKRAAETGWNIPLRSAVTWGDTLHAHYRQTIERVFATRVYDTYGCSEGMQMAYQCGHVQNYHVPPLDVVMEYVDDAGDPVPHDVAGHVVVTRLYPGAMPFIRYRVGDVAVAGDQRLCGCGRAWERLERVLGRESDVVFTPSGNRLIVHYFSGILKRFDEIEQFQVVQNEPSAVDLLVVPSKTFSRDTPERLAASVRERGAMDLSVRVHCVPDIPLAPSGKRRFIVNHLKVRA